MFTQGLAREIGSRGITVNNVQPGPIDTDLNPAAGDWAVPQKAATALDRYGHVDEIAAMVAFVAGPESSVHHRGESDRRWRHERLTNDGICTETTDRTEIAMSAYLIFMRDKTLDEHELATYSKELLATLRLARG